jgi:hypothetical protein
MNVAQGRVGNHGSSRSPAVKRYPSRNVRGAEIAAPFTHMVSPEGARAELDYPDMVALSEMYRRWAVYEDGIPPEDRTALIKPALSRLRANSGVGR